MIRLTEKALCGVDERVMCMCESLASRRRNGRRWRAAERVDNRRATSGGGGGRVWLHLLHDQFTNSHVRSSVVVIVDVAVFVVVVILARQCRFQCICETTMP